MFRAALLALTLLAAPALAQPRPAAPPQAQGLPGANRILAVVNGDVVTLAEVQSRARLFALSAGFAPSAETMQRLEPQIIRLLIDEKLRMQEVQRRQIPVSDNEVAEALAEIERRNNLPRGALVAQLRAAGVQPRALFDQIRAQIGWTRLLRTLLGQQAQISDAEVADYIAAQRARQGQAEFLVGEIFIPVDDPANEGEVRRFVEEVTGQLRRGLPFAIAATQFSQSQTALQGGDLGWQTLDRLDPMVASLVQRMPPGAISNPMRVPGGYQIVTLRARREAGGASQGGAATVLSIRQFFLPFPTRLDPANPTEAQRNIVERVQRLSQAARGCEAIEQAARGVQSDRPLDPGPLVLESVQPAPLRALLARLPVGRASEPLIAPDGVALFMVCSRERREPEGISAEQVRETLLRERVEAISRQVQRELRRRAVIDERV